jgi:phosphoribosylformylglycinamidine cyclo-ligase
VHEREIELAGSAVGVIPDGIEPILGQDLGAGDEIVLVASTGLHANGVSVARMVAGSLPDGYATPIGDGRRLGEAVLDASAIYSPLVEALLGAGLVPTYISHITGHGLLKLMRSPKQLTYRIDELLPVPPVLAFLVAHAGMDAATAYSTFNMGVGLAICCREGTGAAVRDVAIGAGHRAIVAGAVVPGERQVLLEPVGVRYGGDELDLGGRA